MEKSNLDRIKDVLFTNDVGSEEKYEGEMSLHKPAQEAGTNWLGCNFAAIAQVHDFEMSFENITRIIKYEAIYQECKAALETPSPAPSTQQDSQSEKYSINATHVASCMPQEVADATPIPAIPLVEQGNSPAIANKTEMDATPPNLLFKQDSVTLTTTKCAISATLTTPFRQEDFVTTPTPVIIPSVQQGNPSRKTNNIEMKATPPNPLLQQVYVNPATAECAINATLATTCMQEDLAKAKSCVGDDATPTPTLANSHLVKQGNPSGIAINTKIDATPPNPLLQQDPAITNLVLDATPLSIKYHGMNEIIAMNNGEDGTVVKQRIKNANVQASGARRKNRIKLPAPWLDNYTVENKPRASSKVIDMFEKQNSEKKSSSTKRKRKKTASEILEGTNSTPTMNLDEKNSTVLEGGNEEEGMEAKLNLKEEGDVIKQQEVEGSQGGIMASQTPNSESAFKFDDTGFIDVPVLYCAEKFKNLLSSNQGAMTFAASQHEAAMPGYNEHIGNDCQTSWKSSELDELNATKLALETMEAQYNATKQALTIMEAKLDSMIEIERQNRKLLQALNNGTESPTPSK